MKKSLFLLGLTLLFGHAALAQRPVAISVDSLVQAALAIDEQQQILAFEKEKISLDKRKLNSTYLPELNLNGVYNHQSEVAQLSLPFLPVPGGSIQAGVYDQYDFSVQMKALLFDGFSRVHRRHLLNTSLEEQNYRRQYRKKEIQFQVYSQAYQYLYRAQTLQALNNSMARLALQQQRVHALFEQGFASSIDTLDISSRMNDIRLQKISLQSSIRQTLHDLELLSGVSEIDSVIISPQATEFSLPHANDIFSKLGNNFDLQTLNFQSQKLDYLKKQQYSNYLPKMYLAFAYHYGKPGVNFFDDKWMDYWTVGVQFSWNIWRWGRDRASVQQQDYSLRQVSLQKQLLHRATETKAKKYLQQLREFSEQQKLLETMILEKQEKYDLIKQRWEQGQQTTLDVLQAERELTDTEMKKSLVQIQGKMIYLLLNKEVGFSFFRSL
ncbi:MAG: TolC family protein [Calditrichaeota bacterium]|nr:TolC family protein [Calditrichota bacterium]